MENSKLLVPVVLSIMNDYKDQTANALMELKEVEDTLAVASFDASLSSEQHRKELVTKIKLLKSEIAKKEVLVQGFSDIYEVRKWACNNLIKAEENLH